MTHGRPSATIKSIVAVAGMMLFWSVLTDAALAQSGGSRPGGSPRSSTATARRKEGDLQFRELRLGHLGDEHKNPRTREQLLAISAQIKAPGTNDFAQLDG